MDGKLYETQLSLRLTWVTVGLTLLTALAFSLPGAYLLELGWIVVSFPLSWLASRGQVQPPWA